MRPDPRPRSGSPAGGLVSTQSWSYVVVPERAGTFELPAVTLSYFDPKSGRYATAASQPSTLAVRPVAEATTPATAATPAGAETAPPAARAAPALALWLGGGLGVAALLGLGFALGRRAAHPGASARRRLLAALDAGARQPARAAADAFEAAWRLHFGERFGLGGDVAAAAVADRLRERGLAPERAAAVAALFEEIDYLRHAPELSDVGHLREEIVARSKRLARDLG